MAVKKLTDAELVRAVEACKGPLRESERILVASLRARLDEGLALSDVQRDLADGLLEALRSRAVVRAEG